MYDKYNYKEIIYPNGQKEIRYYSTPVQRNQVKKPLEVSKQALPTFSNRSLKCSINRSKNSIYDLTRSNKWDYFVTLTFSDKNDRTDYDLLLKKLTKWINNIKSRYAPDLKYIIVPEQHNRIESNGKRAYHFHGLISNIGNLSLIPAMSKNGNPIIKNHMQVYNIKHYTLGYSTATQVQDTYKVSNYITKYISKALCCVQKGKRRYLTSKNLEKPIITEHFYNLELPNFPENPTYIKKTEVKVNGFRNTVTYLHYD